MPQCIIYARVSTKSQAAGHGIIRQIECCQDYAKKNGYSIRSIYVDIESGRKYLSHRKAAIDEALATKYPIFVESIDRWTRDGSDPSLLDESLELQCCADYAIEMAGLITKMAVAAFK